MRTFYTVIFLLLGIVNMFPEQFPLDSMLKQLDQSILVHEIYSKKKEARIQDLKGKLQPSKSNSVYQYSLNMNLFKEYKPYVCDSAIHYLNNCIKIADQLHDKNRSYESKLKLASLMAATGMYFESVDMINEIERDSLPSHLVKEYFNSGLSVYGELSHYTQNKEVSAKYKKFADDFRDSLLQFLPESDDLRLILEEAVYRYSNQSSKAKQLNDIRLSQTQMGTPAFALVAYHRSLIYAQEENIEGQKYYLALSALSDIQSAIKDHASLWMLAQILYKENDISRAYNYIRFSWSETVFYNARLRSLQSAVILSLIDSTYQATIEKQKSKLQNYLIMISTLSVLFIIALIYIYRQMKRLSLARKNLQTANDQLKKLNEELSLVNMRVQSTNLELLESNQIKVVYIGRFIKLCSTYIEKLDEFRRMVSKEIDKGRIQELLYLTRSQETLDEVFLDLYANFDAAFLRIFPDFVDKINDLLHPDERIILKGEEMLNTELRILALIRLGIQDSSQIADFLRYSVNTIYNYRAKVKNRALIRDNFEDQIMLIK